MATLILRSLECIRRHDVTGVDEPEITVDGDVVWRGAISKGETEVLTNGRADEVEFDGSVMVRLMEISNGFADQIDIGWEIMDTPKNNGKAVFKTSGTHYELEYRVVA
jgi:hypothetical protein